MNGCNILRSSIGRVILSCGEAIVADISPSIVIGGFSTIIFSSAAILNYLFFIMKLYVKYVELTKVLAVQIPFIYEKFNGLLPNLKFIECIYQIKL